VTTNRYFNNFTSRNEQNLHEDLIIEFIQQYGIDVFYCPVTKSSTVDPIYGEDVNQSYNSSYQIEMYVKSVDGFRGEQNILTMANLEIKDQIQFAVSRKRFNDDIALNANIARPQEGDLIYFPLYGAAFQIKYVEKRPYFYQFGDLPTYELSCELWNYSGESLNTGVPQIDSLQAISPNMLSHGLLTNTYFNLLTSSGDVLVDSTYLSDPFNPLDDSEQIQEESDDILDWDNVDPFSEKQV
jgi:hypothetical protein